MFQHVTLWASLSGCFGGSLPLDAEERAPAPGSITATAAALPARSTQAAAAKRMLLDDSAECTAATWSCGDGKPSTTSSCLASPTCLSAFPSGALATATSAPPPPLTPSPTQPMVDFLAQQPSSYMYDYTCGSPDAAFMSGPHELDEEWGPAEWADMSIQGRQALAEEAAGMQLQGQSCPPTCKPGCVARAPMQQQQPLPLPHARGSAPGTIPTLRKASSMELPAHAAAMLLNSASACTPSMAACRAAPSSRRSPTGIYHSRSAELPLRNADLLLLVKQGSAYAAGLATASCQPGSSAGRPAGALSMHASVPDARRLHCALSTSAAVLGQRQGNDRRASHSHSHSQRSSQARTSAGSRPRPSWERDLVAERMTQAITSLLQGAGHASSGRQPGFKAAGSHSMASCSEVVSAAHSVASVTRHLLLPPPHHGA